MSLQRRLPVDGERWTLLRTARVESVEGRCVQCGICNYNCPTGIDIRGYARRGLPVRDTRCLRCGACIARCPRGVLRFSLAAEPP